MRRSRKLVNELFGPSWSWENLSGPAALETHGMTLFPDPEISLSAVWISFEIVFSVSVPYVKLENTELLVA